MLVSGAEVNVNEVSKPDSVKHFHDKPQPTVEKPVKQHGHQHKIQQPRKQWIKFKYKHSIGKDAIMHINNCTKTLRYVFKIEFKYIC
jgi:hypothetical protein